MPALFGLALIGAFCLLGMAIRRWIPAFRTNMVPAFVIAGFLGMTAMNIGLDGLLPGVDAGLFTTITAQMFTLSFISIGLTPAPPRASDDSGQGGGLLRGAWTMGLTWTLVFALQALLGIGLVAVAGPAVGMDPVYGLMLPFAFAQGPGQAVTFAGIFETQGWGDATAVGLAFAAAGFAAAFLVGVPLARWGMRRGLATHSVPISDSVAKGFYRNDEETDSMGRETSYAGNIDTLTVHVALMGIAYVLAHGIAWVLSFIPGFFGDTISGMMFMNGLLAAYFVRWAMRRARIEHLIDRRLQTKITGFATDYVVVASFLAVQLAVVVQWLFPILLTILVATVVTAAATILIGQRYGSDHDFERTLGMYGTLTGTTPTGLALVRIVDPRSRTTTMAEMGLMNLPEMLYLPAMLTISAAFAGTYGLGAAVGILAALTVGYAAIMLVTRGVGRRRTWTLRGDDLASTDGAEAAVPVTD
ncbi:sodium:glutamate symporter [Brachybacterium sp. SGAir0954]|uniref:sodium:glutamate symporter n=1 Tax=Brachybacterium sp. SGAir0954 TaxID=2571029 RepID=UPI0010CD4AF3|nr:sodium:glutamate symporter [Brachybacterium sp. SGAir0954]QCR52961.1 sodium:glutamate symporter [Brachybacterium sp. SGAir0954]